MMRYFIDACKVIIKREGLEGVTAKKVGTESGYSYATIYNYFENLDELILYCCVDYVRDLGQLVEDTLDDSLSNWDQFRVALEAFIGYCADNPLEFTIIFMMQDKNLEFEKSPMDIFEDLRHPKVISLFWIMCRNITKEYGKTEEEHEMIYDLLASYAFKRLYFSAVGEDEIDLDGVVDAILKNMKFVIS